MRNFISQHSIGLVRLLETKVKLPAMGKLYQVVFQNWCFTSNIAFHKDGRVILAWNLGVFNVDIKGGASQWIHCSVTPKNGTVGFECTMVYAFNDRNSI